MIKSNPSYQSNPNHGAKRFGASIEDNGELERNMKKEYPRYFGKDESNFSFQPLAIDDNSF